MFDECDICGRTAAGEMTEIGFLCDECISDKETFEEDIVDEE